MRRARPTVAPRALPARRTPWSALGRRRLHRVAAALVVIMGLGVAACGTTEPTSTGTTDETTTSESTTTTEPPTTEATTTTAAEALNTNGWVEVSDNGATVLMPSEPTEIPQTIPDASGESRETTVFSAPLGQRAVTFNTLPLGPGDTFEPRVGLDAVVAASGGELLSSEMTTYEGREALEAEVEIQQGGQTVLSRLRIVAGTDVAVVLQAFGQPGDAAAVSELSELYFDTLML